MIRDDLTVISHSGTHRKSFREVMDIANTVAGIRQQRPLSPWLSSLVMEFFRLVVFLEQTQICLWMFK